MPCSTRARFVGHFTTTALTNVDELGHEATRKKRIAIIGAGSWGTALAITLSQNGHDVKLWARREDAARRMKLQHRNPRYLSDALIPAAVTVTSDLHEAIAGADLWIFATPSQAIRSAAERIRREEQEHSDLVVVSVAKGIEQETLMTSSQILDDVLEGVPRERIGVLYGPSHAEEVAAAQPTAVVASAPDESIAHEIQDAFMTPWFRVYVNTDTVGVEVGGSVKNVMALAAGISDGVGFGDNAKGALITRGLAEIKRLGVAMGADPMTFSGLAGLGDLVVTCTSDHSRNRYVGEELGKGHDLEEIVDQMNMVAEGIDTTGSVKALAEKHEVDMPITEVVHRILFEETDPLDAVSQLMMREAKKEQEAAPTQSAEEPSP